MFGLALAGVLAAAIGASDPEIAITPEIAASGYLQQAEAVAPGVHVLRQPIPVFSGVAGNVTVIEQSDGLVLIDAGSTPGGGRRIVEMVRRISEKPVKAVVLTHFHSDHLLGLPAIRAAWPEAEIIAHEATAADMRDRMGDMPTAPDPAYDAVWLGRIGQSVQAAETALADPETPEAHRQGWRRALASTELRRADALGLHRVMPTRTFQDRLTLDDATAPVEVAFLGLANTRGDVVAFAPRQRVLAAGDIVVSPAPYMFSAYPREQQAVLAQMADLDFDILIPGHGAPMQGKAYLARVSGLIDALRAQVEPLAKEGLALEAVLERIDLEAHRRAFVGDDVWLGFWFDQYAAIPLIDSLYKEARGEPIGD